MLCFNVGAMTLMCITLLNSPLWLARRGAFFRPLPSSPVEGRGKRR